MPHKRYSLVCTYCDMPFTSTSKRQKNCSTTCARRMRNYLAYWSTVDEVVVDRLVHGEIHDPLHDSNVAERVEAARILTERGYSAREIAEYFGIAVRSVARYRSRLNTTNTDHEMSA